MSYGEKFESDDLLLEARCEHGSSCLPVISSMVNGYNNKIIGEQTVTVTYKGKTSVTQVYCDYVDVKYGSWYYDPVMLCTREGFFSGVGNGKFDPRGEMTREMFVTVLGRLNGIDPSQYTDCGFSDVDLKKWSAPYIAWASEKGIVSGYEGNVFLPGKGISRQEIASVLMRYTEKCSVELEQKNSEIKFTDDSRIAGWAKAAVVFCQTRGLMNGDTLGAFNPSTVATRSEVSVIISNMYKIIK